MRRVRGEFGVSEANADSPGDDWQSSSPEPRSRRERGSVPLRVSSADARQFETFWKYIEEVQALINDLDLDQGMDVLTELCVQGHIN